jgi:hypothetical protein
MLPCYHATKYCASSIFDTAGLWTTTLHIFDDVFFFFLAVFLFAQNRIPPTRTGCSCSWSAREPLIELSLVVLLVPPGGQTEGAAQEQKHEPKITSFLVSDENAPRKTTHSLAFSSTVAVSGVDLQRLIEAGEQCSQRRLH